MKKCIMALTCLLLLAMVVPSGIAFSQTVGTVTRDVSNVQPAPGETVTVSIAASGFNSSDILAVKEELGRLIFSGEPSDYTADDYDTDFQAFVLLSAKSFDYKVKVPATAKAGDKFTITGQFWSDPNDKRDIGQTVLTVPGGGGTGGFVMPGNLKPKLSDIEYLKPYVDDIQALQQDYGWVIGNTTLIVEDGKMPPTKTVQIPIDIVNASLVGNMDIKVSYDPGVLQGIDVTKGSLNADSLFDSNIVDGKVSIAFVDSAGISGDGSVAIMQFKVVGKSGDTCQLVATVSANKVQAGEEVVIGVKNGLFTVEDADKMKGDCDGDGDVDSLDALMALQMSVGKIEINLVADMNDDGQVTSLDAAEIMKHGALKAVVRVVDMQKLISIYPLKLSP